MGRGRPSKPKMQPPQKGAKRRRVAVSLPRAPSHLSEQARRWWRGIVEEYALEEHHLKLLTMAAEAWDRCCAARKVLDEQGLTFLDRFDQPKARPEVAIERDSRIGFARLLRELNLDSEPPADVRPPRLAGTGT